MKNSKSEKILIIDDDLAVRTSLLLLLNNEGYDAAGADSPEQAMTFIKSGHYSLAILDLNFSIDTSGDEGIELLKKIKTTHEELPVILITGWASIELAVKGMKMGASDFINKPWSNDYLMQSIRTAFELKNQRAKKRVGKNWTSLFFQHIIGEDPKILEILEMVGRVAPTDASVLITGESGTGKN
jgi:DNA-binding NtrC family response regulator